jgi:hypothetical protein
MYVIIGDAKLNKRKLKKLASVDVELERYVKNHLSARKIMDRLLPKLQKLGEEWWSVTTTGRGYSTGISMRDLDGFKDNRLVEMLERIVALDPAKMRSSEYANYNEIDYHFEFDNVSISVFAYVKEDSPTCRKVVTGERYVAGHTEYDFKMECD